MSASKFDLGNLTLVIDRNNIQLSGRTEAIMPLEPFKAKLESFGLRVIEVNGHDIEEILQAMKMARVMLDGPTAIILHTTPGKGVSFMENKSEWHGKSPSTEEAVKALEEINSH